jgi:Protein kinase domain
MSSTATSRRVGRYELIREVGRGGSAVVYLARQVDLDRDVALKELAGLHASDPAFIERFLRESRVAGSLNHPNIVTVHEYFEHEGTAYIAMEYFERGSLRDAWELSLPQVAGVLEGILAGLAHAHSRGIVHRDLKPENVMVTSSGGVKIADFGVAKVLQDEVGRALTESGSTVGTPAYMAPEQALATSVGPSADLYAVGVMAYEMLSGEVPFHGSDVAMAVMLQHLNEPVPSLEGPSPDLPTSVREWVERLLAKAPEDRPATAAEAADELDEIVIAVAGPRWRRQSRLSQSVGAVAPPSVAAVTQRVVRKTRELPRGRRRATALAVAVVAVALLAGGIALAVGLRRDDDETATSTPETTAVTRQEETTPPEQTSLGRVALISGDPVRARLRLTGPPLESASIRMHDADISDGHAWFVVAQPGITARTQGAESADLRVRVRKAKSRLRVDLATDGNFDRIRVRRIDGHTVLVTLSKPRTQVSTGSTSASTGGTEGNETTPMQDTTPSNPAKPEQPWTSG